MESNFTKMVYLNGTNYHIWRNKMKDLLFVKKLHLLMFDTEKSKSKSDELWEFEHEHACIYIRQFIDHDVYNHICNETHARTLWNKLELTFASMTDNNELFLLKKMIQLKYRQ